MFEYEGTQQEFVKVEKHILKMYTFIMHIPCINNSFHSHSKTFATFKFQVKKKSKFHNKSNIQSKAREANLQIQ